MSQTSVDLSAGGARPVKRFRFSAELARKLFLRLLALTLIGIGLLEWASLLGAINLGKPDFFALNTQGQAAVMFFAVADLVAAIGLWLTATWGLVVWVATAITRVVRHTVFATTFGWDIPGTSAIVLTTIAYIILVILTLRERRLEVARQRENRRLHAQD